MKHSEKTDVLPMSVACVDDDPAQAMLVSKCVATLGCAVKVFYEPAKCLAAQVQDKFDIIITDLRMPGMTGIELLAGVKKLSPSTEVIIVTGDADKKAAIEAVKLGAYDFFEKPISKDELIESVKRTIRYATAIRDRDRLSEQLTMLSAKEAREWGVEAMVGNSRAMSGLVNDIRKLKRSPGTTVLVTGENGTGKELVARAIHYSGTRRNFPFVPLNCSAVPAELAESILFGHTKGSFTGAWNDKRGYFDMAEGGTLFLDEIGDMPAVMQAKLLRVLEDRMIMPVGGAKAHSVNVRVIAATNADLNARVGDGKFRTDLFYRLSAYEISVQPLRERREDISLLAAHFMKTLAAQMGIAVQTLREDAVTVLDGHDYPGNVRELKNVIERALIESGGPVEARHIHFPNIMRRPASVQAAPGAKPSEGVPECETAGFSLKQAEEGAIRRAMKAANGNASEAARVLRISRARLYRHLSSMQK